MSDLYNGIHPTTAALKNVLASAGITDPISGEPYTESMLLGIGGGLGAGYILWEFKAHNSATIVMGFRNRWNYTVDYMTHALQRISVTPHFAETGGVKKAQSNLADALANGHAAAVWVDKAHLPYQHLPESMQGHVGHIVTVYSQDDEAVQVADLSPELYSVPTDIFLAGRGRISSDKYRVMSVEAPTTEPNLRAAIVAGIADCVEHLGRDSESFALPVYKKWSRLMTSTSNKKGWPVVFEDGYGLYETLRSVYEGITQDGTDGYGLRGLYADFLDEAAYILDAPVLEESARLYRLAAGEWETLANTALSDDVEAMATTKNLVDARYTLVRNHHEDAADVAARMAEMMAEYNPNCPLDEAGRTALYEQMQTQLEAIYDAEVAALDSLKTALSELQPTA
ncbi:MAG: hypothetical protein CL607_01585 [Anaerolineaceae bacterium]|nr:hypothetical protein [Anaerolineaceae bacterium]